DGYFISPHTIMDYLAELQPASPEDPSLRATSNKVQQEVVERIGKLRNSKGKTTAEEFHKKLGEIMVKKCGLSRNSRELMEAKNEIDKLNDQFYKDLLLVGGTWELNFELEKAA